MFKEDVDPLKYVDEKGLKSNSDEGELEVIIKQAIDENPKAIEDYNNGKKKALGAIVGAVMKKTSGKANPAVINRLLDKML